MTSHTNLFVLANKSSLPPNESLQPGAKFAQAHVDVSEQTHEDCAPFIGLQTTNRLLNRRARIEYEHLKARILNDVTEMNKYFDSDDQIIVREYKLCMSVRYRQQIFIMEFRQLASNTNVSNYALDLIFQGAAGKFNQAGRTTLVLDRQSNFFVWHPQLQPVLGGQASTTQVLARLIVRWLQKQANQYTLKLNN